MLDIAENQLAKNIEEGKETSLIFFLKTQGRSRGYGAEEVKIDQSPYQIVNGKSLPDE